MSWFGYGRPFHNWPRCISDAIVFSAERMSGALNLTFDGNGTQFADILIGPNIEMVPSH
jgi:hypothetical protein